MVRRYRDNLKGTWKNARLILLVVSACVVVLGTVRWFLKPDTNSSLSGKISTAIPLETREDSTSTQGATLTEQHPLDPVLQLARESLLRLYRDRTDYTAKIVKRERINGSLGEESICLAKIRDSRPLSHDATTTDEQWTPLSVYLRFELPRSARGREVIWIDGKNENKLIAHESGMLNVMRAHLDPNGPLAMLGNRYPITDIGLTNLVKKLIEKGERDRALGPCEVTIQEGHQVGDRNCRLIQVTHPEKLPHYDFHIVQIFFDPEWIVPLRYACFSWPQEKDGKPVLEEEYTYLDVQWNVGLSDLDFSPDNPAYHFPK